MKIIICDDKLSEAEMAGNILKNKIEDVDLDIETMLPADFLVCVEEDLKECDIAVMDIEYGLDTYNGIDISKKINSKMPNCQIIYLTGILEFASDVYETEHCYFVMKSNMEIMLPRAFEKAHAIYTESRKQEILKLVSDGHDVYVAQKDIIYVERVERQVEIHTVTETIRSYLSIRKMANILSPDFARCHGGFLVNLSHISSINGDKITMDDGCEVFISRTYYDMFVEAYLAFYSKRV